MSLEGKTEREFNHWIESVDEPKSSPDCLLRTGFVETLIKALLNAPSETNAVTAIYGPWGSGKSWILENLIEALQDSDEDDVKVCRFSPWEMKSNNQILEEFFTTINEVLPKKNKKLTGLWEQLERMTLIGALGSAAVTAASPDAKVSFIGGMCSSVLGVFSKLFKTAKESSEKSKTMLETKEEISKELVTCLNRPIIVMIDDLDRLTDNEIQMMIRLLNTTANLPRIHYVIFGDRKQIASALSPICGGEGDRYLEKIVQNVFQVPEPSKTELLKRLSEGVKVIADRTGVNFNFHDERYLRFWEAFLSKRLLNLRDVHRLLRTFSFHASVLMKNDTLEVDLLDLLGVDFLRLFDPESYKVLAGGRFEESLIRGWGIGVEDKKDVTWLVAMIEESELPADVIIGVIASLAPKSVSGISNYVEKNQLSPWRYIRNDKELSLLSIRRPEKTKIYFQLELSAGDIPEFEFQAFIESTNDESALSVKIREFRERGWLPQLLFRLRTAPSEVLKSSNPENILRCLSLSSDSLKYSVNSGDDELIEAFDLVDVLIGALTEENRSHVLRDVLNQEYDVTIRLLIIEYLRRIADCSFNDEWSKVPANIPEFTKAEIDELTDGCLPDVKKRFYLDSFMKGNQEASRAYRMAYALGPERIESILSERPDMTDDKVWKLIEMITLALSPQLRLDWLDESSGNYQSGIGLLEHLNKFASDDFWRKFLKRCKPSSDLSTALVNYINYGLEEKGNTLNVEEVFNEE